MRTTHTMLVIVGLAAGAFGAAARPSDQPLGKILFEPVVINNVEMKGVMYPIDEPALRDKMNKQFDTWIVRSVTRNHLAKAAEAIADHTPSGEKYVLRTVMNVPLTHRADFSHFDNQDRRGKFMDVSMTLTDSSGRVVAQAGSDLVWGDGNWALLSIERSRKSATAHREAIAHDEVMAGYVRKAVDRGVDLLIRDIRKRRSTERQSATDVTTDRPNEVRH